MAALKGSKTEENLKAAFAGESQANRRYLYFANKADIEGQNDVAALFRSTALLVLAFPVQYAGLLAERWYFFAQANHPQNIYYQAIS